MARLRELAAVNATVPVGETPGQSHRVADHGDIESVIRESLAEEEMRMVEERFLAEALRQSEQDALAMEMALTAIPSDLKFQVYAIGYTRAGESEVCGLDDPMERNTRDSTAASKARTSGAWKAAVPLFCFMVVQTNSCGEELGRHCITKSREDFEALHECLQGHFRKDAASSMPKLPGRKLLNANSHAHLQKRLGRYQEYLRCSYLLNRPHALFHHTRSSLVRIWQRARPHCCGSVGARRLSRPFLSRPCAASPEHMHP